MSHFSYIGRPNKRAYLLLITSLLFTACSSNPVKLYPQSTLLADPHMQDANWLVWSPDGKYIAVSYWSSSMDVTDLFSAVYVLDLTTKGYQLFIKDAVCTIAQSWSPDSEELLFYSVGGDYSRGIWRARLDGAISPFLLADGSEAAWSLSGKIAVLSTHHRDITVNTLRSGSQWDQTVFTDIGGVIDGLSWSPDSERLVVSVNNGEEGDIYSLYIIDLTVNSLTRLTTTDINSQPAWSPVSDLIVYSKYRPDVQGSSLYMTNSVGACEVGIPETAGAHSPSWSPDGTEIAFIGSDQKIYSLDLQSVFGEDFQLKGLVCPETLP
jgi:Tol biopolymer transport system component